MKAKKRNQRSRKFLPLVIASSAVVVIALGTGIYLYAAHHNSSPATSVKQTTKPTIDTDAPTQDQIDAGNAIKQAAVQNTQTPTTSSSDVQPFTVTLTTPVQNESIAAGSSFQVKALISSPLSSGTCTLTLSSPGATSQTYTADAQSQPPNSAGCTALTVSGLTAGNWTVTINVTSGAQSAQASTTITVN